MRHTTSNVGVECDNCGKTAGEYVTVNGRETLRCADCGRFAAQANDYCVRHDVDENRLPTGYDSCPKCRMEHDIEQRRAEASYTAHNMHPSVDAKRR